MVSSLALGVRDERGPLDARKLSRGTGFSLAVAPRAARFLLRGDMTVAAHAGPAFGAPIPLGWGAAPAAGNRVAMWLGPDEWLLIGTGEAPEALAATIEAALVSMPHSLVDISERQIGLEVFGPAAALAINAGCPLDLRESSFPVGTATRTMLSKAEIVLWRRETQRFHIEVWRSFAEYAVDFLEEAALRAPL
jgi:sarcosine oxidase subunit gamma